MTNSEDKKISWSYCPGCGNKLPKIDKLNFCTHCGIDLNYILKHKTLPPRQITSKYLPRMPSHPQQVYYKPYKTLITDDNILDTKDRELWGTLASIGFPLLAFVIMNVILIGIMIGIILSTYPYFDYGINIVTNQLFLVLITLVELILIMFPLIWAGKNLENPNLKNRLTLLGFTAKVYNRKGIVKEFGIGLGFALIGLGLVVGSSIAIEFIFRLFFTFEESTPNNVDVLITGFDILVLVLMIVMMLIIVGPCEEILFRGFMMKGLTRTLGKTAALWITALVFAGIHLVGLLFFFLIYPPITILVNFIMLFVPYLAISLMLGLLYRWRDENLIAVIVTHGVYNSLTLIIAFLFLVFY
ncbi:MAG: CPBP family intramembrane glutamic endopeptidase [Candidatus Hodarchaeota archaeon]